jgi:hypothetical protein
MGAICSDETPGFLRSTRCYIQDGVILQQERQKLRDSESCVGNLLTHKSGQGLGENQQGHIPLQGRTWHTLHTKYMQTLHLRTRHVLQSSINVRGKSNYLIYPIYRPLI